MIVENCMHDAILTAMDNVVFPRVEMAVTSITGSSGQGPSNVVQNPDRRDFTGNTENTPTMAASGRLDLNVNQDRNDETRNVENFEDGEFPAWRPNYDRRANAHHRKFFTVPRSLSCSVFYYLFCSFVVFLVDLRPHAVSAAKHMLFERHQGHLQSMASSTRNCQQKVLTSNNLITGIQQTVLLKLTFVKAKVDPNPQVLRPLLRSKSWQY